MEAQIQVSGGDEVAEFAKLWDRLGGDPALRTVDRPTGEWELGDATVTVTSPSGKITLDAQRVNDAAVIPLPQEVLRDRDEW